MQTSEHCLRRKMWGEVAPLSSSKMAYECLMEDEVKQQNQILLKVT